MKGPASGSRSTPSTRRSNSHRNSRPATPRAARYTGGNTSTGARHGSADAAGRSTDKVEESSPDAITRSFIAPTPHADNRTQEAEIPTVKRLTTERNGRMAETRRVGRVGAGRALREPCLLRVSEARSGLSRGPTETTARVAAQRAPGGPAPPPPSRRRPTRGELPRTREAVASHRRVVIRQVAGERVEPLVQRHEVEVAHARRPHRREQVGRDLLPHPRHHAGQDLFRGHALHELVGIRKEVALDRVGLDVEVLEEDGVLPDPEDVVAGDEPLRLE